MSGPTQRSMEHCRKLGWHPAVVEKWIPQTKRRADLYGGIDLVIMDDTQGLLGVQATSGSNTAARETKLSALPSMVEWLNRGLRLEVWGWRKLAAYKKDGTRAKRDRWALKRRVASLEGGKVVWGNGARELEVIQRDLDAAAEELAELKANRKRLEVFVGSGAELDLATCDARIRTVANRWLRYDQERARAEGSS